MGKQEFFKRDLLRKIFNLVQFVKDQVIENNAVKKIYTSDFYKVIIIIFDKFEILKQLEKQTSNEHPGYMLAEQINRAKHSKYLPLSLYIFFSKNKYCNSFWFQKRSTVIPEILFLEKKIIVWGEEFLCIETLFPY